MREINRSFELCSSCKRMGTAVYMRYMSQNFGSFHEEFIRSKHRNFSAHVYGVSVSIPSLARDVRFVLGVDSGVFWLGFGRITAYWSLIWTSNRLVCGAN